MNKQTQQDKLLQALKEGPVNSYRATYLMGIKQAPTRIKELRDSGIKIKSILQRDRSVNWVLEAQYQALPKLEDQYIFLPNGTAVRKEAPRQEALI